MIYVNNMYIHNEDTSREYLNSMGLDHCDIQELIEYLCEEELNEAKYKAEAARQEHEASELKLDDYNSLINEVLNILDDMLKMQRITKTRERLEQMRKLIYNGL